MLFGYACHPSTMSDYRVGPDYVGYARDWIAAACRMRPRVLQGCARPQGPLYAGKRPFGCVLARAAAELGHELGPRGRDAARSADPVPTAAGRRRRSDAIQLGRIIGDQRPWPGTADSKSHRLCTGAWRGDVYFGSQGEIGSRSGCGSSAAPGAECGRTAIPIGASAISMPPRIEGGTRSKTATSARHGSDPRGNAAGYVHLWGAGRTGQGGVRDQRASEDVNANQEPPG